MIKVLERLNISDLIHKNIAELSGGQQQRVMIARALISEPAVLVLDEPTNGIDAKHVSEFYNTLDQLKQEGITIILVTHDIGVVADTATEVACLNKHLHFHGTTDEFKSLDEVEISKFMDILYVLSIISIIENVVINKDLSLFKMEGVSQLIDALLNFDFMRYSLISGILIGFIAPLIGAFIVVRRLSLIADALSHVTLGGISFGMFLLTIMPTLVFINPMWFWNLIRNSRCASN